jgi:hypothetical protein
MIPLTDEQRKDIKYNVVYEMALTMLRVIEERHQELAFSQCRFDDGGFFDAKWIRFAMQSSACTGRSQL